MSSPAWVSVPDRLAVRLGYAGLAPFVLGALLAMLVRVDALPYVVLSLSVYAGMIIAFLGGIHWALGMTARTHEPRRLLWALVPTALGWVSVMMPPHAGLVIQGVALVACYLVDRRVYPAFGLSKWMTLRFRLTFVSVLSCFIAAARI
jgi:hypothetical protein